MYVVRGFYREAKEKDEAGNWKFGEEVEDPESFHFPSNSGDGKEMAIQSLALKAEDIGNVDSYVPGLFPTTWAHEHTRIEVVYMPDDEWQERYG